MDRAVALFPADPVAIDRVYLEARLGFEGIEDACAELRRLADARPEWMLQPPGRY